MFNGLQIARGIAAILVLLAHTTKNSERFYAPAFGNFFSFGVIGVDFFFVLSGFIIYWAHQFEPTGIEASKLYIKKRLIRIYPPFILLSLALYFLYIYYPSISKGDRAIGLITSIFLIPTPPLEPALSVSWTLMHELLFYFIFLTYFYSRKLFPFILIFWIGSMISAYFSNLDGLLKTYFLNPYNLEFLIGVFGAWIVIKEKHRPWHLALGVIIFLCFVFVINDQIYSRYEPNFWNCLLKGIGFMLIITGLCAVDNKVTYPKFFLFIGAASYSIYLIHNTCIAALNRIAQKIYASLTMPGELYFLIIASASLGIGCLYYILWEKPILVYLRKKLISKNDSN